MPVAGAQKNRNDIHRQTQTASLIFGHVE